MPLLVKLAIRNLWRNRRRTVITFSALSLGIMMLIATNSLSSGFGEVGFQNLIDFETGEIKVHAPGYFADRENLPLEKTISAGPALDAALAVDGVRAATPRVVASARLNVGWEEFPVMAVGVDPATDGQVFELAEYVQGRMPQEGAAEAAIGAGLAGLLDIHAGDYILLVTRTRDNALQALDLQVVGLIRTPNPAVNEGHVYLPLDLADTALALQGGVTELVLRVEDGRSLAAVVQGTQEALTAAGIEGEVFRWEDGAADLIAMMQTDAASNFMLISVILVIALVGVTNTILLGTLERRQEIGAMKAMGMREGGIVRLFLLEATGIGLLAVATGSALGALANPYLVEVGIDFTAIFGDIDIGLPVRGNIHGVWNGAIFLWGALAGIITCWIAGFLPARRAARQDAATTVRG